MSWQQLRARTNRRDVVSAALFEAGAAAVQDEGDGVTTHYPSEAEARAAADRIRELGVGAEVEITASLPVDYSTWRAAVGVWRIDGITVAPPWLAANCDPQTTVIVDPAMAFGTGEHPTTRGTLRLMQRVLQAGDVVADLGTGSGVLAIAAAKLGAARVIGIEHDADAVANAERNVVANQVEDRVSLITGDAGTLLRLVAPVQLVLANIASLALLQLLPVMHSALVERGRAVISGVLVSEAEFFRSGMHDWLIVHEHVEDDWWTAAIKRQ